MPDQDYLQKSKKQKTTAWVLLGGGAACILLADLIGNGQSSTFSDASTGVIIAGAGVLCMLGSIPEFLAAGKNKRKANAASTFFKIERIHVIQQHSLVQHPYPAISVKIGL